HGSRGTSRATSRGLSGRARSPTCGSPGPAAASRSAWPIFPPSRAASILPLRTYTISPAASLREARRPNGHPEALVENRGHPAGHHGRALPRGKYLHARRLFENRSVHEGMRAVRDVSDRVVRRRDAGVAADAGPNARVRSGETVGQDQWPAGWTNGRTHGPEA